ncbi:hypothetical protein QBC37DRAFT_380663 [Rhypophila decipiens]|uniref:DUF7779 domain-containing protein n=1 Tax=Rhypophila decipiens TaxID=261697 RepID=A0AAN6Y038_9PEZI|nr:hypothetical protein QBC37DRAFT_380663 [Rhypophila decipiens]
MSKLAAEGHTVPAGYPNTTKDFVDARTVLFKSSLVQRTIDRGELIIHRIIQDAARLKMEPKIRNATFESPVGSLCSAWLAIRGVQPQHSPLAHLYDIERGNLRRESEPKISHIRKAGSEWKATCTGTQRTGRVATRRAMYDEPICEAEPEYADWAQMKKGRALSNFGQLEEASDVLVS